MQSKKLVIITALSQDEQTTYAIAIPFTNISEVNENSTTGAIWVKYWDEGKLTSKKLQGNSLIEVVSDLNEQVA